MWANLNEIHSFILSGEVKKKSVTFGGGITLVLPKSLKLNRDEIGGRNI